MEFSVNHPILFLLAGILVAVVLDTNQARYFTIHFQQFHHQKCYNQRGADSG